MLWLAFKTQFWCAHGLSRRTAGPSLLYTPKTFWPRSTPLLALDFVALRDGRIDDLLERHAGVRVLHLIVLGEDGLACQPLPVA